MSFLVQNFFFFGKSCVIKSSITSPVELTRFQPLSFVLVNIGKCVFITQNSLHLNQASSRLLNCSFDGNSDDGLNVSFH